MQVARTILEQMGGDRFALMTGAKNFVGHEDALSFKFPRANKINYVKITLNSMDLYNLEFSYIHKYRMTTQKVYTDVGAEQLQSIFTEATGLFTKL